MAVKVKVCGITQYDDAKTAINLGVDALGFNFYAKSLRYISAAQARAIIRRLPPFVSRVGIFVDADPGQVDAICRESGIDTIQFHGSETPEYCARFSCAVIKAFSVDPMFDTGKLDRYGVSGLLLDTWDERSKGGTGKTFDWDIARMAQMRYGNIILAGGLGPTNLEEALSAVQPFGVDLNSGVEIKPGVKNPVKIRDALKIIRDWR